MKYFLAIVAGLLALLNFARPTYCQTNRDTVRLVRSYYDVSRINMLNLQSKDDSVWVLVNVRPDFNSKKTVGLVRNPNTGKYAVDDSEAIYTSLSGQLNVLRTLTGAFADSLIPYTVKRRGVLTGDLVAYVLNPDDDFSALSQVGLGLVEIEPNRKDKYTRILLMPAQWNYYFDPALKFFDQNKALLLPTLNISSHSKVTVKKLTSLLDNTNPLIVIAASQKLGVNSLLSTPSVYKITAKLKGERQAVLIYNLLKFSSRKQRTEVVKLVKEVVSSSKHTQDMEGVVLALCIATHDTNRMSNFVLEAKSILKTIYKKAITLPKKAGDDKVFSLLDWAGVVPYTTIDGIFVQP